MFGFYEVRARYSVPTHGFVATDAMWNVACVSPPGAVSFIALLPTVLRDWWGFSLQGGLMEKRTARVIIDYQNIHLTGYDAFASYGTPKYSTLIHPLRFAQRWLDLRNHVLSIRAMAGAGPEIQYELDSVVVFRGLPSNKENPNSYRRNLAQQSEWTRDRRVTVTHRGLRYFQDGGQLRAQEKGIDVMVALEFLRSADRHLADAIILASHDTDLEPALAMALETDVQVETVGWDGCRILRVPKQPIWHTRLTETDFKQSIDPKQY